MLAQPWVGVHGVGGGDRAQVTAALVEHEAHPPERLQATPEPRLHPTHSLGHGPDPPVIGAEEVKHTIGLSETDGPQHDGLSFERRRHFLHSA